MSTMTLEHYLLASYLDDGGWHCEAENVRQGVDLESYEIELRLIDWLNRHTNLAQPAQAPAWQAIVEHCMMTEAVTPVASDPYGTIGKVIDWHQAIARPAQAVDVGFLYHLIGKYWDLAYAEGKEGRDTDTHTGEAQRTWQAIEAGIRALSGEKAAQVVEINATELKIEAWPPRPDGMCAYAPKGVKVTHKPTGITVACDDERSGHMNRDKALRGLAAMLHASPAPDKEG